MTSLDAAFDKLSATALAHADEVVRLRRVNAELVAALRVADMLLTTIHAPCDNGQCMNCAGHRQAVAALRAAGLSDEITEIASAVRLDGMAGKSGAEPSAGKPLTATDVIARQPEQRKREREVFEILIQPSVERILEILRRKGLLP